MKTNVVICPPCGESVAVATKEGQNKGNALWPLLPRLTAVLPPQGREITTHGFTLIELLVVVLIIGILTAIAVPQYQKAVEKDKAMQAITLLKSVHESYQLYYLENGKYPSLEQLNITIPWQGTQKWLRGSAALSNEEWSLQYGGDSARQGISIGRLTGPYAGAGFIIYVNTSKGDIFEEYKDTMLCFETNMYADVSFIENGHNFGEYCEKLFNGRLIQQRNSGKWYLMP